MKIYWTRYALTTGIQTLNVEPTKYDDNTYTTPELINVFFSKSNKDEWFKTKAAAVVKAESMRVKKRISLEKQLSKIKNVTFEMVYELQ